MVIFAFSLLCVFLILAAQIPVLTTFHIPSFSTGSERLFRCVSAPVSLGVYANRNPYFDWCEFNTTRATAELLDWMNDEFQFQKIPGLLSCAKLLCGNQSYRTLIDDYTLGIDIQKLYTITDLMAVPGNRGWASCTSLYFSSMTT